MSAVYRAILTERLAVRTRIAFLGTFVVAAAVTAALFVRDPPSGGDWWLLAAVLAVNIPIGLRTEFLVTTEARTPDHPGFSMVYDADELLRIACLLLLPVSLYGFVVVPYAVAGAFLGRVPSANTPRQRFVLSALSAAPLAVTYPIALTATRSLADDGSAMPIVAGIVGVALTAAFTVAVDCFLYLVMGRGLPKPWYMGFAGRLIPIDVAGLVPVVFVLDEPLGVKLLALLPAAGLVPVRVWVLEHFADRKRQRGERSLLERAATIAADGRAGLARDVHDGPLQAVLAVKLVVDDALRLGNPIPGELVRSGLDSASADLRELLAPSSSAVGDRSDLASALETIVDALESQFVDGIDVRVDISPDLPGSLAAVAYEIALEAARNAAKHSGAARLDIRLSQRDDVLCVRIHDTGVGFDPAGQGQNGHLGLQVMRGRVTAHNGTLEVESAPGGSTITALLPIVPAVKDVPLY